MNKMDLIDSSLNLENLPIVLETDDENGNTFERNETVPQSETSSLACENAKSNETKSFSPKRCHERLSVPKLMDRLKDKQWRVLHTDGFNVPKKTIKRLTLTKTDKKKVNSWHERENVPISKKQRNKSSLRSGAASNTNVKQMVDKNRTDYPINSLKTGTDNTEPVAGNENVSRSEYDTIVGSANAKGSRTNLLKLNFRKRSVDLTSDANSDFEKKRPKLSENETSEHEPKSAQTNDDVGSLVSQIEENSSPVPWKSKNGYTDKLYTYFTIIQNESNAKQSKLQCTLCVGSKLASRIRGIVTCPFGNNSNMKRHMQIVHPEIHEQMLSHKALKLNEMSKISISKDQILDESLRFIVNEALPLSKIDSQHFWKFIHTLTNNRFNDENGIGQQPRVLFGRKAARARLEQHFDRMKDNIKNRLKLVEFTSCTCDLWTFDYRTFIAMKSHYIDEKSGKLISDLLALRRMETKHHVEIKTAMVDILNEYDIRKKTTSITTDNAGEFRCSFSKFSDNFERFKENYDGPFEFDMDNDDDNHFLLGVFLTQQSRECDNESDCNDVIRGPEIVENVSNIMPMQNEVANKEFSGSNKSSVIAETDKFVLLDLETMCLPVSNHDCYDEEDDSNARETTESDLNNETFPLPNRSICNPHTLSLIGKNDLFEALSNEDFANDYFETFELVNQLWHGANKSNKNVNIVRQLIGKKIHKPHRLRWNRIYDSIKQIVNTDKDYLNVVCRKLKISEFSDKNFDFMREFLKCLQPIAETITVLEGDILYGHTLPALFTIEQNFEDIRRSGLFYTLPLLNAIEDGFEKRYKDFLDPFNKIAAPYFLAMVSHPSYKLDCIQTDKHKTQKIYNLLLNEAQELSKKNVTIDATTSSVESQNSTGIIMNPRRGHMTDEHLEQMLMFKINGF